MSTTPDALRLADDLDRIAMFYRMPGRLTTETEAAAELRRLAAVEAERDRLRQQVEALTDDALARVMAASEDELNAALKLEGKDPEDTARLGSQAMQIATLTHERDQLRAEVAELRADAERY